MAEVGETGLPASIETAWGLRERPGKGPRPGLSLERIVAAGVRVAAAEGLAAVSMSRVATDLGASTMSLYRYVAAKDELLTLMMDAAAGPPPADLPRPGETWRDGLSRWAWAYRAILHEHPWIVRIPISGPPAAPNNVAWLERALRCLRGTGLAEGEKVQVILLLSGYVRSEAALFADLADAARAADRAVQDAAAGYGRLLARLIDPDRFPALTEAVVAHAFDDDPDDPEGPDADFVFGLERILDGVDVLVRARGPT